MIAYLVVDWLLSHCDLLPVEYFDDNLSDDNLYDVSEVVRGGDNEEKA